jgi:DUF3102 family protein
LELPGSAIIKRALRDEDFRGSPSKGRKGLGPVCLLQHDIPEEIRKAVVEKAIRIGALLTRQKANLEHGEWLPWIKANLGFSPDWAQNRMHSILWPTVLSKLESILSVS